MPLFLLNWVSVISLGFLSVRGAQKRKQKRVDFFPWTWGLDLEGIFLRKEGVGLPAEKQSGYLACFGVIQGLLRSTVYVVGPQRPTRSRSSSYF